MGEGGGGFAIFIHSVDLLIGGAGVGRGRHLWSWTDECHPLEYHQERVHTWALNRLGFGLFGRLRFIQEIYAHTNSESETRWLKGDLSTNCIWAVGQRSTNAINSNFVAMEVKPILTLAKLCSSCLPHLQLWTFFLHPPTFYHNFQICLCTGVMLQQCHHLFSYMSFKYLLNISSIGKLEKAAITQAHLNSE